MRRLLFQSIPTTNAYILMCVLINGNFSKPNNNIKKGTQKVTKIILIKIKFPFSPAYHLHLLRTTGRIAVLLLPVANGDYI